MTIASQFGDRVNKLILVGSTAFNSPKERKVFELCRSISGWSNERRAMYEKVYGSELQDVWSKWIDQNSRLNDFISLPALAKINCECLLLYGEKDIVSPIDPHARHLKRNLKNSRIHIFSNVSHYCHQEKADEFNAIVDRFLFRESN